MAPDPLVNLFGHTIDDVPLAAVRRGGKVSTLTQAPDAAIAAGQAKGKTVVTLN
ncbi:hypothetical protein [Lentzea nigeriaca]|uniref:hypothetical protein n=1 Tax=Lentzea nigeriaca TaxID=1128665 RepID=UPI001EF98024|nr:hypothetical protein [Lentzea nigeriaca]MBM7857450.1 hypothetical protein [Lentzea nigeriaca]